MIAPMPEPMMPDGCRNPSDASLWKIRKPRKPPTNDPTMPSTMVRPIDIDCLPGTISRARAPAIRPTMMTVMMVPMSPMRRSYPGAALPSIEHPVRAQEYSTTPRGSAKHPQG